jgi:UDP:flavonoid glycosyltransferase YjiC (YdhE family)
MSHSSSGREQLQHASCAEPRAGAVAGTPSVVFVVDVFPSHVTHTFGLAQRLRDRGVSVEFWGSSQVASRIVQRGFPVFEIKGMWPLYEKLMPGGVLRSVIEPAQLWAALISNRRRRRAMSAALRRFEKSIAVRLASRRVDVAIFHPFNVAYHTYFRARGIKCVVLTGKPVPVADPAVPPPTSWRVPADGWANRLYLRALWAGFWCRAHMGVAAGVLLELLGGYSSEQLLRLIGKRSDPDALRRRVRRGLPYDLHFRDVEEWLTDAPEFDFPRHSALPENIRYVGLCVDFDGLRSTSPVRRRADARFLIYVSMGVSMRDGRADIRLLRRIIAALRPLEGAQVMVSTGSEIACAVLKEEFPDVDIFASLPQLALLRQADLAVTHAGSNTVRECIVTNTPMLAFPREFDQPGNCARIVFRGIGLRGSRTLDRRRNIAGKALAILEDPQFYNRIRALSQLVSDLEDERVDAAIRAALLHKDPLPTA